MPETAVARMQRASNCDMPRVRWDGALDGRNEERQPLPVLRLARVLVEISQSAEQIAPRQASLS